MAKGEQLRKFIFTGKDHSEVFHAKTKAEAVDAYLDNFPKRRLDGLVIGDKVVVEEIVSILEYRGQDEASFFTDIN